MLGYLRRICSFPPATLAFYKLSRKKKILDAEKVALSSVLFRVFRTLVPPAIANNVVFEYSRVCFGLLYLNSNDPKNMESEIYKTVSLTCPISFGRLVDPVFVIGSNPPVVYERTAVKVP